jgi:UDP-N-acetylglucosamine 1-carboxyvinyltransferase
MSVSRPAAAALPSVPRLEVAMDKFVIHGGAPLEGTVEVSGAKNAVLPMMAATLLTSGQSVLRNVPVLRDVSTMSWVLAALGAEVHQDGSVLHLDASECTSADAPYELVKTMRASVYVLGPLLARFGHARVSLPGGCAWGPRPVNLHLAGLEALGARVTIEHGYIVTVAERLRGATFRLDIASVGATANLMMAACLAEGTTVLENAAREPEIPALADFLNALGGRVEGGGTSTVTIHGVTSLHPATHTVIPDRIEAGTFIIAGAMAGGELTVARMVPEHVRALLDHLAAMGVAVEVGSDWVRVRGVPRPGAKDVSTDFYPGFPTDLQAQIMAMATRARGTTVINEGIYRDRFTHVPELGRLGAKIEVVEATARVEGVERLSGAQVMASDLRASAALILAGLVAEGETVVSRVYHIDRGYESIEKKLNAVGARVARVRG